MTFPDSVDGWPTPVVTGLPSNLLALADEIHADNIRFGWWKQVEVPGPCQAMGAYMSTVPRNVGELLCLIHSEISEADVSVQMRDDKLPHRRMREVELADTAIRVLDMLGYYKSLDSWLAEGASVIMPRAMPQVTEWGVWIRAMHRTTSAAMEHFRKNRVQEGCGELFALLNILHAAAIEFRYDLTGAIAEKRAFNAVRLDHKLENRQQEGGKAF